MRKLPAFTWALGLAAVALQAMALATQYFQPWLDSDYLLPQRFVGDVLGGRYPLSGWSMSSSLYLFPDFLGSAFWYAVTGGAPVLPYYVVTAYVALALLAGWSLRRAGGPGWGGWLAGAALVNFLLAWRGAGDHARWLWWLGTATFHGGAVLLGLAQFALWAGPTGKAPRRGRWAVAAVLMFLGALSDTLFLTQFVVPIGFALAATAGAGWRRSARFRSFMAALVGTLAAVAVVRVSIALAGWWRVPAVFRHAPTPVAIEGAAARFARDLAGPLPQAVGGFLAALIACPAAALLMEWRERRADRTVTIERRQAGWFAGLCLISTLALPLMAVYWTNPQNGRYILPCLVIPEWWMLACLRPRLARLCGAWPSYRRAMLATLAAIFGFAALVSAAGVRTDAWRWPYPARVAELDRFLAARGLQTGLADYWNAHYVEALSRNSIHVNQLDAHARVKFWDNNAFHHFERAADGRLWSPVYRFILVDDLDESALLARFGPPAGRAEAGGYRLWLYDGAGSRRVSAAVDAEVRAFLGDRPGTGAIAGPAPGP